MTTQTMYFTDPVCGMQVTNDTAAGSLEYHDQPYFFCSKGCMDQFEANPEAYASA